MLGQDVERVARDDRRLDGALVHPPRHDRRLEQVAAVLREDDALARRPDLVAGPPDSLKAARDARRALDLDDEVHRAHVDAELERARGHQGRQASRLELLLDREALLAGDAAVMGLHELLAGEIVQALREPLAETPAVDEDDRAAMRADQLEDRGVDGRPDARAGFRADGRTAGLVLERQDLADGGHVLDGDDDLEFERLARARIDDGDVAARPDTGHEPGDRLERSLRGGQADALGRARVGRAEGLESLERQGEMRAALGAGDRMDLVDDHVVHVPQRVARGAREHQVERFGGRDEDVRRATRDLPTVLGGGVAGARGDRDAWDRLSRAVAPPARCRSTGRAGSARCRR